MTEQGQITMLQRWEYVCVSVIRSYGMNYRRNGVKVAEWKDRPIFDMLGKMGEEGFELTAYDGVNYIFKRALGSPVSTQSDAPAQPAQGLPRPPLQQRPPQAGQPQQRPPQPGGQQAPRPLAPQPPAPRRGDTDGLRGLVDDDED